MKIYAIALLTVFAAGNCYAEAGAPSVFLGEEPASPKVQAFYQAQCEQAAASNGELSDDASRGQFVSTCIRHMADTWPIGYEESE